MKKYFKTDYFMKAKKKSLNLKKFSIANLNQTVIVGGTDVTVVTCPRPPSAPPECYIHSVPIDRCVSIGQLKSFEALGATCTDREDLNTQFPQHVSG
jgi:hypothetical protein